MRYRCFERSYEQQNQRSPGEEFYRVQSRKSHQLWNLYSFESFEISKGAGKGISASEITDGIGAGIGHGIRWPGSGMYSRIEFAFTSVDRQALEPSQAASSLFGVGSCSCPNVQSFRWRRVHRGYGQSPKFRGCASHAWRLSFSRSNHRR